MMTKSWLLNLGRITLFAMAIILALGWLVAPDLVAKHRDRFAAFVRLPVSVRPRVVPPVRTMSGDVAPPLQKISAQVR